MRPRHFFVVALACEALCPAGARAQPEADVRTAVEWLFKAGNYAWEAKRSYASDLRPGARPALTDSGETQIGGCTTLVKRRFPMVLLGDQIAIKTLDGWVHGRDLSSGDLLSYGVISIKAGVLLRCPHEELQHLMGKARQFRREGAEIVADLARTEDEYREVESYMRAVNQEPSPGRGSPKAAGGLWRVRAPPPTPLSAGNSVKLCFQLAGPAIEEFRVEIRAKPAKPVATKEGAVTEFTAIYVRKLNGIGRTKVVVDPIAEALLR